MQPAAASTGAAAALCLTRYPAAPCAAFPVAPMAAPVACRLVPAPAPVAALPPRRTLLEDRCVVYAVWAAARCSGWPQVADVRRSVACSGWRQSLESPTAVPLCSAPRHRSAPSAPPMSRSGLSLWRLVPAQPHHLAHPAPAAAAVKPRGVWLGVRRALTLAEAARDAPGACGSARVQQSEGGRAAWTSEVSRLERPAVLPARSFDQMCTVL